MGDQITIKEKINEFVKRTSVRLSERTALVYRQALDLFSSYLNTTFGIICADDSPSSLTAEHMKSFLEYLQENKSIETEHLYSRGILSFFYYAFDWNDLSSEYAELVTHLDENRREKEYLVPLVPVTAIEKILSKARLHPAPSGVDVTDREKMIVLRDKGFILVLSETGLRVSEMCDLRRKNINPEKRSLTLSEGIEYPLSDQTHAALRAYLTARMRLDGSQQSSLLAELPLFARHDKKAGKKILPLSRWTGANIINFWQETALLPEEVKELESVGMTISPHTFRHYFVLKQLEQSNDVNNTQKLARHSDSSTTRRYLTQIKG